MARKRLLDVAVLVNAVRSVAREHVAIRQQQIDVWSQTSTLAKAAKNQTDRVTLTVQAASALAQRLAENGPSYANASRPDEPLDGTVNARGSPEASQQDHHYTRSPENATLDPIKKSSLNVSQEIDTERQQQTLWDGTVVPREAAQPVEQDRQLPDTEMSREDATVVDPLDGKHSGSNTSGDIPEQEVIPEQDELPEGVNTDVFHSPRVAKKLGGRTVDGRNASRESELHLKGKTGSSEGAQSGTDQESYHVRYGALETSLGGAPQSQSMQSLAADLRRDVNPEADIPPHHMRESSVPASRFGRLWQYGSLATSMAFGAVGESLRRATGSNSGGSLMLGPANMERLVARLSRMRGAALKLGQMMSFQAPIAEVLQRVQDNADYMPASQRDRVLAANLGPDWQSLFASFNDIPLAAASIGQVHKATLADGREVAVKIQYPGVAGSISSDLSNLSLLLTASRLLPKGLFLDKTIANARTELAWECDYEREAKCQERFRDLIIDDSDYRVPRVVRNASGPQVLTADFMHGTAVTKPSLNLSQEERDWIGTRVLDLCLRELTEFRFMQTDPNWTNFLYNRHDQTLELLDFGASREYPPEFVDPYIGILRAATQTPPDRATVRDLSVQLGYLTGAESKAMRDAHVSSVTTLAEPFRQPGVYDFRDQTVTDRVRGYIPTMVRERLAAPPEETYSLHRKLSGAFLMLARLGSRVECRSMFERALAKWEANAAGKSA